MPRSVREIAEREKGVEVDGSFVVMVAVGQSARTSSSSSQHNKNKKYTMDLCKQCFLEPEAKHSGRPKS